MRGHRPTVVRHSLRGKTVKSYALQSCSLSTQQMGNSLCIDVEATVFVKLLSPLTVMKATCQTEDMSSLAAGCLDVPSCAAA